MVLGWYLPGALDRIKHKSSHKIDCTGFPYVKYSWTWADNPKLQSNHFEQQLPETRNITLDTSIFSDNRIFGLIIQCKYAKVQRNKI